MFTRLRSFLRALASRREFEDGMDAELSFHIEEYTGELVRSGVPPEEAGRRARMELGGLNSVKGGCRTARGLHVFDELSRELRHAVRLLRRTPGFTTAALITLALCLGANLAIFAVLDSILLRPLQGYIPFTLPNDLSLVPTEYKLTVAFLILVVVLLVRPTGIFKGAST